MPDDTAEQNSDEALYMNGAQAKVSSLSHSITILETFSSELVDMRAAVPVNLNIQPTVLKL